MTIDLILLVWFLGSSVFLFAVEAACVVLRVPTISERLQSLGRSAPLVGIVVAWLTGAALIHFFG